MSELPKTWWADDLDGESRLLIGLCARSLHVVAPPGVRCRHGEPDEERVSWRHAIWWSDEQDPPAVHVDSPHSVISMQTSEVVQLLPVGHHDFVRLAMARHISRAVLFALPAVGRCPEERYARVAGQTHAWVVNQLSQAFPTENWFRFMPVADGVPIPDTADELLRQLSAVPAEDDPLRVFG